MIIDHKLKLCQKKQRDHNPTLFSPQKKDKYPSNRCNPWLKNAPLFSPYTLRIWEIVKKGEGNSKFGGYERKLNLYFVVVCIHIIPSIIQSAKILLLPSKCEIIFGNLPKCSPFSCRSSNFAIAKIVALILFA